MIDPITAGIGATALAALSKPIEKLIDVCASGANLLYEPTRIRRRASAEGDAMVILEEARVQATDAATRLARRLLATEVRRQETLEAIVDHAALELPDKVSNAPVNPDWATRFFREAQDISDEAMQVLWGKLLAGEVAKPGSFSPRTLRIVGDLTPAEAKLFERLSALRFVDRSNGEAHFFIARNAALWTSLGLSFTSRRRLVDAGLITENFTGLKLTSNARPFHLEAGESVVFVLEAETPKELQLGHVALTSAGAELCSLVSREWNETYVREAAAGWKQDGWKVEAFDIVERVPDGTVRIEAREFYL